MKNSCTSPTPRLSDENGMEVLRKENDTLKCQLAEAQADLATAVKALEYISEHGIPQSGAPEKTWLSCYFSMTKRAEYTIEQIKKGLKNEE